MGSFDYAITTRATPEQALAYLADLENLVSYVKEIEVVDAQPDGGYKVHLDRGIFLPDMVFDYTVARGGDQVVATGTHSAMTAVDTWDVAPADGGGSSVHYHGTYELHGVSKAMAPLAQAAGKWRAGDIAEKLQRQLDRLA